MKRISLSFVIFFVLVSTNLFAQGIGFGIKAGANFANQKINDINMDNRTGFHGGAYIVLAFSEKWAIQPEVFYSSQGADLPDNVNDFKYLSVPVLIRWKPIRIFSIAAGPQFSRLMNAKDIDGISIKEEFKKSDFGLTVGGTVHLPLGINAGLRYVWGFTNVDDLQNDREIKNKMAQVFVGWTIIGAK